MPKDISIQQTIIMRIKKRRILTNNREIYHKFNMLNFSPEVVLKDVNLSHVNRILKSVNRESDILIAQKIGEYIIIKKINPIEFNIYFMG